MLTKTEINAASSTLDSTAIEMWLALIRANDYYRSNKVLYPDVEIELDNASGDVKGRMLNALLSKIEALGIGEVAIVNGDEGLNYSQKAERDALVKYALSVLYDAVEEVIVTDTSTQFGNYQVRQRQFYCPYCSCTGFHYSWCSRWYR